MAQAALLTLPWQSSSPHRNRFAGLLVGMEAKDAKIPKNAIDKYLTEHYNSAVRTGDGFDI